MNITVIDPANRIRLPADWAQAMQLHGLVALEKTAEGILVRPYRATSWDEVFATKLVIGSAAPAPTADDAEASGDDLLF